MGPPAASYPLSHDLLSPAQSPAAPVDPLQQAYAGMQHYTGEGSQPTPGLGGGVTRGKEARKLGLGFVAPCQPSLPAY